MASIFFFTKDSPLLRNFISFSYDGTAYHGWQVQPNSISVQQKLNEALSTLLRKPIDTVGAGRTDTGVHAAKMVAHFDYELPAEEGVTKVSPDLKQLCFKLNRILPPDIAIHEVRRVTDDAHARFDATARTYHYHVFTEKSPFRRHYATRLHFIVDFEKMNEAAKYLLEVEDFTSFSKLHTDVKTNICHVTKAEWKQVDNDLWRFEIRADRFLRNMVRAVVGTLLEVGRRKISFDDFKRIIARKDRCAAGDSVPACALSLVDIEYSERIFQINAGQSAD